MLTLDPAELEQQTELDNSDQTRKLINNEGVLMCVHDGRIDRRIVYLLTVETNMMTNPQNIGTV